MELADYKRRLDCYLKAEAEILEAAVATVEGQSLTMADLSDVRAEIIALRLKIAAKEAARVGPRTLTASFDV